MIGLLEESEYSPSAEIGWVVIPPAFHRTYVTSNAVSILLLILLLYALELQDPDTGHEGLGSGYVQWPAHDANTPSHAVASCMEMKEECVMRWALVMLERRQRN